MEKNTQKKTHRKIIQNLMIFNRRFSLNVHLKLCEKIIRKRIKTTQKFQLKKLVCFKSFFLTN